MPLGSAGRPIQLGTEVKLNHLNPSNHSSGGNIGQKSFYKQIYKHTTRRNAMRCVLVDLLFFGKKRFKYIANSGIVYYV